jgi:hypothetical protein
MKIHKALIIGFALTTSTVACAQNLAIRSVAEDSQTREGTVKVLNCKKAEMNYLVSLNSGVPGVVESALGHVTLMRIAYPNQNLGRIQEKLYDLASKGATKSIRQKAFIAMQVFADPTAYKGLIVDRQANGDGLLEALATQM